MKKKITIIGPTAFGYTKYISDALLKKNDVEVNLIQVDRSIFKYKNTLHRIKNFFSKTFLGINLKKKFQDQFVNEGIDKLGFQDFIFTIRPDMLSDRTLKKLKKHTKNNIAFYYDSITRFPRKNKIIPFFHKVYSYDKEDIESHSLFFLTNYIYETSDIDNSKYDFFNISSHDFRFNSIEMVAKYIAEKGWTSKVLVHHPNKNTQKSDYLEVINKVKSVSEINELMKHSKIIFEIQRNDQIGLSFRIFEALGHNKKLITTNKDIVNYDFYNPQNILVIDENNIDIPDAFVNSPYVKLDESLLKKYHIDNWVAKVFELD